MEIEHRLDGTQVQYGYIWWKKKRENEKYRKVFPVGKFTLDFEGQKLAKHVDWDIGRVSIGSKVMQRHFQQDDTIIISKFHDNTVIVRKKSCGEYKHRETNNATRVYILARELNAKSTTIVKKCQKHNFDIKNHMSLVSPGLAGLIREWFSKPK